MSSQPSPEILLSRYLAHHVFLPRKLPQKNDYTIERESALAELTLANARKFDLFLVGDAEMRHLWKNVTKMLAALDRSARFGSLTKEEVVKDLRRMKQDGETRAFLVRMQNAAVIIRRKERNTIFESFEVSPTTAEVVGTQGKLLCEYPGPAVAVPNTFVDAEDFIEELANFMSRMDEIAFDDAAAHAVKAKSTPRETRDTIHPRYITELLTAILLGKGEVAAVPRIRKRIGDEVLWKSAEIPWRRSSLWLVIRVALQTTLERQAETSAKGFSLYKSFILFLHARFLEDLVDGPPSVIDGFESELLFFMSAKMSRRAYKLAEYDDANVSHVLDVTKMASRAARKVRAFLELRHSDVLNPPPSLPRLDLTVEDFERDKNLRLTNSRSFIERALNFSGSRQIMNNIPSHTARVYDFHTSMYSLEGILTGCSDDDDRKLHLIDFEQSILHLDQPSFFSAHSSSSEILIPALYKSMQTYHRAAATLYQSNPESMSTMFLTLLLLWVVADNIAMSTFESLSRYCPDIKPSIFDVLVLRVKAQLDKLHQAREYLTNRIRAADRSSILTHPIDQRCFPVLYFRSSYKLQRLKDRIEKDAGTERESKRQEFHNQLSEYTNLKNRASEMEHRLNKRGKCQKKCPRCMTQRAADSMSISVHEWPLPRDPCQAEASVFELRCPPDFVAWRDANHFLVVDAFTPTGPSTPRKEWYARLAGSGTRYAPLTKYSDDKVSDRRVALGSSTKSFLQAHYHQQKFCHSPSIDSLCVNNGLNLALVDTSRNCATDALVSHQSLLDSCSPSILTGPYSNLTFAVLGTTHTSNEIIAKQSTCNARLSLDDFYQFGTLRSGPRIQWWNILRQLCGRSLNYRHEEVHVLYSQAVHQVGESDGSWHMALDDVTFRFSLLAELEALLNDIRDNWLELFTLRTAVDLLLRLLAADSSSSAGVAASVYRILKDAREAVLVWLKEALKSADRTHDTQIQNRILVMAATALSTFDAAQPHLSEILSSTRDVEVYVQCAACFHDYTPSKLDALSADSKRLIERVRRILINAEDHLWTVISSFREGLDKGIKVIWRAFCPNARSRWTRLNEPDARWITCFTSECSGQQSLPVHFNILTGSLLVNGRSTGRLPTTITCHKSYRQIFGLEVLDVLPANMLGMEYMTVGEVRGHQVFFRLDNDELFIVARRSNANFYLIPGHILAGDLPAPIIDGHTHWLSIASKQIIFRPDHRRWQTDSSEWILSYSRRASTLTRQDEGSAVRYLMDHHSGTAASIHQYLHCIEHPTFQIITYSMAGAGTDQNPLLEIQLPRSGFSFFFNSGRLYSREVEGFYVDEEQFMGTMLGLQNQLVLARIPFVHCELEEKERSVLVPKGIPLASRQLGKHRIDVHIPLLDSISERVVYSVYRVDPVLGRLKFEGIPDMFTRFQELYLHALTSLVLPDPLTKLTGMELALHQLHGADCFSFSALKPMEIEILHRISELSPVREFYPVHLRSMETVSWSGSISVISQHDRFRPLVDTVIKHHERVQMLATNDSEGSSCSLPTRTNQQLYERALHRSFVYFRERDKQDVLSQTRPDKPYALRCHTVGNTARFNDVIQQANSVSEFSNVLSVPPASDIYTLLGSLSKNTISGLVDLDSLSLHPDLLQAPKDIFVSLINLCRHRPSRATLLFTTAVLAYSTSLGWTTECLATLYAVARLFRLGNLISMTAPNHPCYSLSDHVCLQSARIKSTITSHAIDFYKTPDADLPRHDNETWTAYDIRRRDGHRAVVNSFETQLITIITAAWSRGDSTPQAADFPAHSAIYFNIHALTQTAKELFASWRRNAELHLYATNLTERLGSRPWLVVRKPVTSLLINAPTSGLACRPRLLMTLSELIKTRSAPESIFASKTSELQVRYNAKSIPQNTSTTQSLVSLARNVEALSSEEPFSTYSSRLYDSISALDSSSSATTMLPEWPILLASRDYNSYARVLESVFLALFRTLAPNTPAEDAVLASGLWPDLSRTSLLCLLRHNSKLGSIDDSDILNGWKLQIIGLAKAVIALQTARRRLLLAQDRKHHSQLAQDLSSTRKQLSNQSMTPDWLLMQIDSDVVIRDIQFHIAHLMLPTHTNDSICLQLNMGEGKSSVIAPMVACAIADGTHLSRIIVLKTLASQMSLTMRDRISGLVNRRLYYLPFSRTTKLDDDTIRQIETILTECIENGGVLITQPEQILSFKLKAVGCQIPDGDAYSQRSSLARIHALMTKTSRDILDESDEILHVRYQLVYTSGDCQALEGHPHRWTMTQELLHLAADHIIKLRTRFPASFASQGHAMTDLLTSSFPALRLVEGAEIVAEELVDWLVDDIMDGRLSMFNPHHLTSSQKNSIRIFISSSVEGEGLRKEIRLMRDEDIIDERRWNVVLLCRGLLAFGVLLHTLQDKRHRVDYGLDEKRTQLAVPYRAKDLPSTSAEFAHPDVVIILTCLSYYFRGLTEDQLELCLQLVASLDDPETEYSTWIFRAGLSGLPPSLMTFKGLNFDSPEQRSVICKHFQLNQRTVDFYLRSVVFPKEAKQFASRLSCSSWDIVEPKANITTGFSGTNDFRDLLPIHITQKDPLHQLSTNARVLNHLLRDENDHYECFDFPNGQRFVEHVAHHDRSFRIILDVGAQMLDIGNKELAAYWLKHVASDFAIACIYVNGQDQLIVLHRSGHEEQLVSSYISQQLDRCIFYLDDAHTRGIDLRLPAGFTAAVTLGPKVTKDRLVQGCMRMRRLGAGHTVSFFGPADVDRKIREVAQLHVEDHISAKHVLLWTIAETCSELKHRSLQWVYQGLDHARRRGALNRYWSDERRATLRAMKAAWIQPESRTVESMYGINSNNPRDWVSDTKDHPELRRRCATLGLKHWGSNRMTLLDEEQEREIAHEIEREEQVERPNPKKPAQHVLGKEVRMFVDSGELTSAFRPAFSVFDNLKPPAKLHSPWISSLLMTSDFARTIKTSSDNETAYFRPVHWVLSNTTSMGQSSTAPPKGFVVISPFEVNELAFTIMKSTKVRLHLFTSRTTLAMSPCEDLGFFVVPSMPTHVKNFGFSAPSLIQIEIMLFSGQLYLRDYAQYLAVCEMLGLYASDLDGKGIVASVDGFIPPSRRGGNRRTAQFTRSPIAALTAFVNIRRKALSFDQTHIGKILSGRRLFQDDFASPSGVLEEVD